MIRIDQRSFSLKLRDFYYKLRGYPVRVTYYDGTVEYMTQAEWENDKREGAKLRRYCKEQTPFLKMIQ